LNDTDVADRKDVQAISPRVNLAITDTVWPRILCNSSRKKIVQDRNKDLWNAWTARAFQHPCCAHHNLPQYTK